MRVDSLRSPGSGSPAPPPGAAPAGFNHRLTVVEARRRLFGEAPTLRIARYRIERRLGAGGMGEVYLAVDEALDRKVAIKRVLTGLISEREQQRLRREARALARLSHPNVVQVYEIGEHERRTYLAMEYVDGQTLAEWLAAGGRTWTEVLARFVAAGQGLAAAHEAGVIHRDFKPENVLISRDGGVRVADFGLALAGERGSGDEVGALELERRTSVTGSVAGTVRYMALEQLLGQDVDARSDQFSFCVALYEALWGEPPFAFGSLGERIDALEQDRPRVPPSAGVPARLWRLIRRGLARSPSERWPDMKALLAALEALPRRRRRTLALAVAAPLLVASLVGAAAAERREQAAIVEQCEAEGRAIAADWSPRRQAEVERAFLATGLELAPVTWSHTRARMDAYASEWAELRTQTCHEARLAKTRSEQSRAAVVHCLDEARMTFAALAVAWTGAAETDATRDMVFDATVAASALPLLSMCSEESWLAQQVPADPLHEVEVDRLRARLKRVRALELTVRLQQALDESERVLAEAKALGWPPLIAEARASVARTQHRLGEYERARATAHRAFLEATAAGHDYVALRAAADLTMLDGVRLGQPERGLEWGALAETLLDRLDLRGTMHEASVLFAVARVRGTEGDLEGALEDHRRALVLDERAHGPSSPDKALSLNAIGSLLRRLDRHDEALAAHREAAQVQAQVLGPGHPELATTLDGIGRVAQDHGQLEEAIANFEEAIAIREATLGPEHVFVAYPLAYLGECWARKGELERTREAWSRALTIFEATFGPEHDPAVLLRERLAELDEPPPAEAATTTEQAAATTTEP